MRIFVNHDLIPAAGRTAASTPFNVNAWTIAPYLAGETAFTAHEQLFYDQGAYAPVVSAIARFVWSGPGAQVRPVSLRYNAANQPVWNTSYGSLTLRPAYNVDQQQLDVTAAFNADMASGDGFVQWFPSVLGVGNLYMARLEIVHDVPDLSPGLAALAARVAALESKLP